MFRDDTVKLLRADSSNTGVWLYMFASLSLSLPPIPLSRSVCLSIYLEHKTTYLALCLQPPADTHVVKRWFQSVEQVPCWGQVTNQWEESAEFWYKYYSCWQWCLRSMSVLLLVRVFERNTLLKVITKFKKTNSHNKVMFDHATVLYCTCFVKCISSEQIENLANAGNSSFYCRQQTNLGLEWCLYPLCINVVQEYDAIWKGAVKLFLNGLVGLIKCLWRIASQTNLLQQVWCSDTAVSIMIGDSLCVILQLPAVCGVNPMVEVGYADSSYLLSCVSVGSVQWHLSWDISNVIAVKVMVFSQFILSLCCWCH